jgi:hypothetical protein
MENVSCAQLDTTLKLAKNVSRTTSTASIMTMMATATYAPINTLFQALANACSRNQTVSRKHKNPTKSQSAHHALKAFSSTDTTNAKRWTPTATTTSTASARHARADTFCTNSFASLTQLVVSSTVVRIVLNAKRDTRSLMGNATA